MGEMLPLFPLGAVLYPGMLLPLHIFEERYRQLVRDLLDGPEARRFGVIAIRKGRETGVDGVQSLYEIGCIAVLRRVDRHEDGRYDIVAVGTERFRLLRLDQTRPYPQGEVETLAEEQPDAAAGPAAQVVEAAFREYLDALTEWGGATVRLEELPGEPVLLSFIVAAAMVVDLPERQALLAEPDTLRRLARERSLLSRETAMLRTTTSRPAPDLRNTPYSPNLGRAGTAHVGQRGSGVGVVHGRTGNRGHRHLAARRRGGVRRQRNGQAAGAAPAGEQVHQGRDLGRAGGRPRYAGGTAARGRRSRLAGRSGGRDGATAPGARSDRAHGPVSRQVTRRDRRCADRGRGPRRRGGGRGGRHGRRAAGAARRPGRDRGRDAAAGRDRAQAGRRTARGVRNSGPREVPRADERLRRGVGPSPRGVHDRGRPDLRRGFPAGPAAAPAAGGPGQPQRVLAWPDAHRRRRGRVVQPQGDQEAWP